MGENANSTEKELSFSELDELISDADAVEVDLDGLVLDLCTLQMSKKVPHKFKWIEDALNNPKEEKAMPQELIDALDEYEKAIGPVGTEGYPYSEIELAHILRECVRLGVDIFTYFGEPPLGPGECD